jgi:hypothetical protein
LQEQYRELNVFWNEDKNFNRRGTLMRFALWPSMAALTTLLAGSAAAMPTPAPYHADSGITLAAGGCGVYYHRNVYGACVPNGYGGVVVAPGFYGGGYYGGGGWHGGGWHGGYYHGGGWHGGGWHGGGAHWHGGGAHWHGGGAHWHGGGYHHR